LTPRELATLRLTADGKANKEIASELGISERTVKTHLGHLFEKLGVTSRTEAIKVATRRGLVRRDGRPRSARARRGGRACAPVLEIRGRETSGASLGLGVEPGGGEGEAATLRAALARHGVLCLRMRRPLAEGEFDALAQRFGPIKDLVAPAKDGSAFRYGERRQIIDSGFVLSEEIRARLGDFSLGGLDDRRPGLFETYHS